MNIAGIGIRNISRNKTRTTLTVLGGAVAVLAFILLRTVLWAWNVGVDYAAKDRLATRHKVSFIMPMPKNYIDSVRQVPGVKKASYANWFGAKDSRHPDDFFASLAVEPQSFLDVFPEMSVKPDEKAHWLEDRKGAIVGDVLAKKLGVKAGDRITLTGTIYPGEWEFNIDGIYEATQKSVDRSQLLFHWNYLNETLDEKRRDHIGWISTLVDRPDQSANVTAAIDKIFDEKDVQTTTMSERNMNNSFMATFSAILTALDFVSIIILFIMMLILGNTIAMGVRERTREYGVLRALGFTPKHVSIFVIGEALTIGVLSGLLGLALSYPVVQLGMGRWLEENMGSFFPYFRLNATTALVAVVLSTGLGALAAIIPARQASKLSIIDALRRVG
ncbi:MAG TPA: FtsX-like permease family protein [Polyangiaceae bacterium]|nr:FtsX-like permease family protein [Polyangiaceae bacterium]